MKHLDLEPIAAYLEKYLNNNPNLPTEEKKEIEEYLNLLRDPQQKKGKHNLLKIVTRFYWFYKIADIVNDLIDQYNDKDW